MSDSTARVLPRVLRVTLAIIMALIFVGLVTTVLALSPEAAGLSVDVHAGLARSGIQNPVTATLLDFRSYDTLLEIAVLLLAVVAVRALCRGDASTLRQDDQILVFLGRALLPVMILIAGYLLMAGIDAAGGAFQAGAVLAAAGVLLLLAGSSVPPHEDRAPIRIGLAIGLAAFIAVGIAGMLAANAFLDYPQRFTGAVVLMLEAGVTVSVAFALLELFVSVLRSGDAGTATGAEKR